LLYNTRYGYRCIDSIPGRSKRWKAYEFYERVSVHVCIQLISDLEGLVLIPFGLIKDIMIFYYLFKETDWIEEILNLNRIFKERFKYWYSNHALASIIVLVGSWLVEGNTLWSKKKQSLWNLSGLSFKVPVGAYGDCYDRYLVRLGEIRESCKIIEQVCNNIEVGPVLIPF